jgi:radical SAM superfamily enzyme YgiQ (UPF0313 family)
MNAEIIVSSLKSNTDCMGSFGLGFDIGKNIITKFLGFLKSKCVNIPDLQTATLITQLRNKGYHVNLVTSPSKVDQYYIQSTLNGYKKEIEMAKKLKNVYFYGAMCRSCRDLYEPYGKIIEIDQTLSPSWDYYDISKFRYFPSLKKIPVVSMITAYGCKYKCSYCPYSSYYGEWSPRGLNDVYREIDNNVNVYKVKSIIFRDPLFTADRERTIKILNKLMEHDIQFACETRIENVDVKLLDMMKKAGCKSIHFGVESGNKEVLKSVNRVKPDDNKIKDIIDYCEKIGIKTTCFFILGFPKDTEETIRETIELSKELSPNVAEFFISTPYPGTKLSKSVIMTKPYEEMTGYKLCFKHGNFTEKRLSELRETAYKEFYFRLKWLFKFFRML